MDYKIIETPIAKDKIELKVWLTGGDRRAIDSILSDEMNISMSGPEMGVTGFKGSVMSKMQDKTFETVIVSINDSKENIVQRVLDMRDEDFDFVVEEINKITKKKIKE